MKARTHRPQPEHDRWMDLGFSDREVGQLDAELTSLVDAIPDAVRPDTPLLDKAHSAAKTYLATKPMPRWGR